MQFNAFMLLAGLMERLPGRVAVKLSVNYRQSIMIIMDMVTCINFTLNSLHASSLSLLACNLLTD